MIPLKCFIASNRYGSYCVPAASRHRPAAATILGGEVWEPETLAFLGSNCGRGDVVHAGTYFGDFLPALSHAVGDAARIWAFEPSSENHRCAEITLKLNAIGNVVLAHGALGAACGEALLCTGAEGRKPSGGASAIAEKRSDGFVYETVRTLALDDVIPADRNVAIVQLDVEKYEQQALTGALATIQRCRPLLVLETLPSDQRWFAENILSLGYEASGRANVNYIFRPVTSR